MKKTEIPDIVTVIACPPDHTRGEAAHNSFIDEAVRVLGARTAPGTRIVRAATVHDLEMQISQILPREPARRVKLQIVGHSLSGALLLGAAWLPDSAFWRAAHDFPFYALTSDPMVLGLLAPHAGKFETVMVVGCNVGSDSSYGYAVNGRTLTYALAELLRCEVLGADDLVSPDDFDAHGWYRPSADNRRPQGWRWVEGSHPEWVDGGPGRSTRRRAGTVVSLEIRSITSTRLPVPGFTQPIELQPPLQLVCRQLDGARAPSALPEISLETEDGPAHLLCSGRYLKLGDTYYAVEGNPQLSAVLSQRLWERCRHAGREDEPARGTLASSG